MRRHSCELPEKAASIAMHIVAVRFRRLKACPWEMISFDPDARKATKRRLCNGKPKCVAEWFGVGELENP